MTQTCSVSGSLKDIIGNSSPDQIVEFYNLDTPYLSGANNFGPPPARTVSDPNGNFVIQLIPGHYRMAVDGIPRLMVLIPSDVLSFVISSTTQGITSVFVAQYDDLMKVKVSATDTVPDFLYAKINAPGATILNRGGNEQLHIPVGGGTGGGVTPDVTNPPLDPTQPWLGLPGDLSQWQWIVATQTWVQTTAPPALP